MVDTSCSQYNHHALQSALIYNKHFELINVGWSARDNVELLQKCTHVFILNTDQLALIWHVLIYAAVTAEWAQYAALKIEIPRQWAGGSESVGEFGHGPWLTLIS